MGLENKGRDRDESGSNPMWPAATAALTTTTAADATMVAWAFHELTTKPGTRAKNNGNSAVNATVRDRSRLGSVTHTAAASAARLIVSAPAARPAVRDPAAA